jgi:putative OPT family oligopeptide transporter
MMAGGVLSYLVLIPLITFLGDSLTTIIAPGTKLIRDMSNNDIRNYYVRYIGAGAVTFGGIMTFIKTLPTIVSSFRDSFRDLRSSSKESHASKLRTERDIPIVYVIFGAIGLVLLMTLLPNVPVNFFTAIMVVVFGFFFVTVSSRIVGLIGSSSNPISGMTIATLMATCLIFLGMGWTGDAYQPIALCVGSIVCIASANAGATSQDLKTGYLVGATPVKQQIGLIIGVIASVIAIGFTVKILHSSLGFGDITPEHPHALPAPQANLMATIIKGMLSHSLPWGLVLIGMAISAVMELCGVSSLAFAVGAYLPLSTTSPIWIGGLVKWFADRKKKAKTEESEISSGALFSSGLIAGGALTGIIIAVLLGWTVEYNSKNNPINFIEKYTDSGIVGKLGDAGDLLAIACFAALGFILYRFAVSKQEELS